MDKGIRGLSRRDFLSSAGLLLPSFRLFGQGAGPSLSPVVGFLPYDRAQALIDSAQTALPPDLAKVSAASRRAAWPSWIRAHDIQIRARARRGEEDTLVNFVLFGVSFTDQPRIAVGQAQYDPSHPVLVKRIEHFIDGISSPGNNARLTFLRALIRGLGHETATAEQRDRLAGYVEQSITRYLVEKQKYDQALGRSLNDDTRSPFAATAHLYKDRGLSLDTDFRPNFGIERALSDLNRRGLLKSVRRVAIIGPGLDFTDKDAGFDHYPLQTLQPFSVVDSLLRLGLTDLKNLHVTLFDISEAVIEHVSQAVVRARNGQPYGLQLVLDQQHDWVRDVLDYWGQLGNRVGSAVTPLPAPPQAPKVMRRAVQIRADVVRTLRPVALNVVTQSLNLASSDRYDLVVATNIFIYYDAFDQALALLNIQSMLGDRGVLLSNDLFENFSGVRLRATGSVGVDFSPTQADQIRIYSAPTFQPQLPPQ